MPKLYYIVGLVAFLIWGWALWKIAIIMPGEPRAVELSGALLTLFPIVLDLLRKYYVRKHAPPPSTPGFALWAHERVRESFLGYESLYAFAVFLGISLLSLGFAMDLHKPH